MPAFFAAGANTRRSLIKSKNKKQQRRRSAAIRKKRGFITLDELYCLLSAIKDEMERETDNLMSQKPKLGSHDETPVRRAAHTLWARLDVAFMKSERVQEFAEQVFRDIRKYDGHKAKHETSRSEQDRRLKLWGSDKTEVVDWGK